MTKELDERAKKYARPLVVGSTDRSPIMRKLEQKGKFGESIHIGNISKIMGDLNATRKSLKLNLAKIKEQNQYLFSASKKENMGSKGNRNGVTLA